MTLGHSPGLINVNMGISNFIFILTTIINLYFCFCDICMLVVRDWYFLHNFGIPSYRREEGRMEEWKNHVLEFQYTEEEDKREGGKSGKGGVV